MGVLPYTRVTHGQCRTVLPGLTYDDSMTTMAHTAVVDLLSEQAGQTAAANPPSRVAALVVLGLFTVIGWTVGRTWYHASKGVIFCALAVRYGYRNGMKVPVEPKAPASGSRM